MDNQKSFQGRIIAVNGDIVSLELEEDKKIFNVEFSEISRGRLIFEAKIEPKILQENK